CIIAASDLNFSAIRCLLIASCMAAGLEQQSKNQASYSDETPKDIRELTGIERPMTAERVAHQQMQRAPTIPFLVECNVWDAPS
ncbi:MAG: hypothetical protein ACT4QC_05985, partial [Planctomycetaceae bacterium]